MRKLRGAGATLQQVARLTGAQPARLPAGPPVLGQRATTPPPRSSSPQTRCTLTLRRRLFYAQRKHCSKGESGHSSIVYITKKMTGTVPIAGFTISS